MTKLITKLSVSFKNYLLSGTTQTKYLTYLLILLFSSMGWGQSTTNYAFSTNATGSLSLDVNGNTVDMTTGTTQLVGAGLDASASAVTNIGFNYIFMGTAFTQFSVQEDGILQLGGTVVSTNAYTLSGGSLTAPRLSAFNQDFRTGTTTGKIHYKLIGSSPNRCLVVEFLDMQIFYTSTAATGTSNWQMRLYETTGQIEYVYGTMTTTSGTAAGPDIGFYTGSTTNSRFSSVSFATHSSSTATYAVNASPAVPSTITNLNSASDGSRRIYKFTPPNAAVAPSNLTFTSVTASTTTLNWVDNSSSEIGNLIYRSIDGVNYTLVNTTVANATTYIASGLIPSTTYYWRVVAFNEGSISSNLDGSQATANAAVYYYVGTNSQFSTLTNWNTLADGTGTNPPSLNSTDVYIVDGEGTTAGAASLLYFGANTTIGQLKVTNNTTLDLASSTGTKTITITGGTGDDLIVENGSTLNFSSTSNLIAMTFSGSNNTGDISGNLILATGNTLTTTGGTNTIVTVKNTGVVTIAGTNLSLVGSTASLIFTNGSNCNVTGTTTGAYPIPLATWTSASNLTLSGSSTSTTTAANNVQSFGNFTVNLTSLTGTLSFWTSSTTAVIQGNLTITAAGTTGGAGIFRALTTGTLTVNGDVIVTQGRLQSASGTGTFNVLGNTIINTNGILDINGGTYNQKGATFTNDGTLTAVAASTRLAFTPATSLAQTFAGSGIVLTNIGGLSLSNPAGLTITHTNQITTLRVNLFQGTITGSNKITFGTGLSLGCTTQIGSSGLATPGGSFDTAPIFNLGTGTYSVIYQEESVSRTTGFEIPSTRTVSNITNSNLNGIVLSGGNLSSAALTFSAGCGNITTTSSNILRITGTATSAITRTSTTAFVNGPIAITLPASLVSGSTYLIPVGKSTINAIELINPITNSGGTVVVQAEVFDASTGGTASNLIGAIASNRYWAASITAGSANFTSTLIRLNDVTTGFDAIAASSSLTGAYNLQGGINATIAATTIANTSPALTTLPGFFVLGTKSAPMLSNVAISPSGNQCTNVSRAITVTATPVGGTVSGVALNYSINGVAQTAIAMTNTSGNNWAGTIPTVTPTNANVTWSITATDSNTLIKTSTGIAYSDEPNLGIVGLATASLSSVCNGNNSSLSINLVKNDSGVIGSGSVSSSSSPTPFSGSYGGMKGQYIILASELTSSGYISGNITGIGINFVSAVSTTYTGLTIQIGNTSLNAFNSTLNLESNLTTVYGPTNLVNPAAGVKTFTLTTPFNWDGVSNIIISTSWSNNTTTSTSGSVITTTTSTNLAQVHKRDSYTPAALLALAGAQSAGSSTVGTSRPNFTIIGNKAFLASTYSWSDGSTVVGTTNPLIITPTSTTTYTGTATLNGCPITASTTVTVNVCANTWTGTTSNSWNTSGNWSLGTVPTSSDNIVISSNTPNAPVMDVDVTIPSGKSLTLSGTGSLSVAPGKVLTIAGTANFNGKAVIFKSDAAGAGMFGPLTTGTLTGATNVQVERFIPARRAYRFLSPSVTTSTTIRQNWQEDGVNTPGFGTHITGATGASAGFDPTETNNSSLLLFNSGAWVGATSTNVGLTAGNAYCLMVRGDRTTDLTTNTPTASNTVLRATGTLFTGNFSPALSAAASGYSFVGNPYQAPLDIKTALQSSTDVNKNVVYYWDPTLNARGGYITRNLQTSQNIPASSVNDYVQPGQAFFVVNEPTLTGTPALTFTESHKSVANAAAGAFRNANSNEFGTLRVNLQANTNNQWTTIDGTLAIFNDNFSWNVTSEDATKMTNLDEEVSFVQNNTNLAIALQSNPSATSELPIKIGKMRHTNYQWQFELDNYNGATPYLFDTLNNSYTQINNGTAVPFTADSTTTNRFKVVFQNAVLSNATFQNTLAIYPNPAKAGASFYVDGVSEATVTVSNLLGQTVPVQTKSLGTTLQVTPNTSLSKGVYLVTITTQGNTQQVKWIVE